MSFGESVRFWIAKEVAEFTVAMCVIGPFLALIAIGCLVDWWNKPKRKEKS